jgi:hypothetical protein
MTIGDMLRLHGNAARRYVLPSGRVTFGAAASSMGLAVPAHTFHGGDQREAIAPPNSSWWMDKSVTAHEVSEMAKYFPGFHLIAQGDESPPQWTGTIATGFGNFEIRLEHRQDHSLPLVIPVSPTRRIRQVNRRHLTSPHLFTNGNLCVAAEDDWHPESQTMATVVGWAADWHAHYVSWRATSDWPSETYDPA